MPILRRYNKDFFKNWSPDMAYIIGFFAADGYMIRNKRGGCFIDFYSNDIELIEYIRLTIGSNHTITKRKHSNKNLNCNDSYRLQIGSKEWFNDLSALGFSQKKSKRLQLPYIPEAYIGDFVRGYFDGDGCVHLSRYYRKDRDKKYWLFQTNFTSGSKKFLYNLHERLRPYISGGSLSPKADNSYSLAFSARDSIALYKLMYQDSTRFGMQHKLNILRKGCTILNLRA